MEWKSLRWILLAIAYVIFMAGLFIILTTPARAQQQVCVAADQVEGLAKQWDETLFAVGKAGELTMRLYVNVETRAWTAFIFRPDGVACAIASGDNFYFARGVEL